eukprot:8070657-Pyramimonas_sp.AAC.1
MTLTRRARYGSSHKPPAPLFTNSQMQLVAVTALPCSYRKIETQTTDLNGLDLEVHEFSNRRHFLAGGKGPRRTLLRLVYSQQENERPGRF